MVETQRIRVDELPDETQERIKDYAEERGLRRSRAYRELIVAGLETEGF